MNKSDQKFRHFVFAILISWLTGISAVTHANGVPVSENLTFNHQDSELLGVDTNAIELDRVFNFEISLEPTQAELEASIARLGQESVLDLGSNSEQAAAESLGEGDTTKGSKSSSASKLSGEANPEICDDVTIENSVTYKTAEKILEKGELNNSEQMELATLLEKLKEGSAGTAETTSEIKEFLRKIDEKNALEDAEQEEVAETSNEDTDYLKEKIKALDEQVEILAKTVQQIVPNLFNALNGGGREIRDAKEEKKQELKEIHSQVRAAARKAMETNSKARANIKYIIAASEARLRRLERAGAGASTAAVQLRKNVDEYKKYLVDLEQQKGRIVLSKRAATSDYEKGVKGSRLGDALASFDPRAKGMMDDMQVRKMQSTMEKLETIEEELADIEAVAASAESILGGEASAQNLEFIDGWIASYIQANEEAKPNPTQYEPERNKDGSLPTENTFITPFPHAPKVISGRPL